MNSGTPKYYQPYDSGEDTDDGSAIESEDYDSDELPEFEDSRIRREEDPRYALIRTAGPNFNTSAQQLKYMEHAPGASYDTSTNITSLQNLVYLNPPKTTQTSLFSVKSVNRDVLAFPSPFNFVIKTPRVYKNVTKVQLVQISFPNNTSGYTASPIFEIGLIKELLDMGVSSGCLSTCVNLVGCNPPTYAVGLIEKGRLFENQVLSYTASIPSGFHTKEKVADLLNNNANNTPPLNCISYDDFKKEFQITHDISILFNEPGEKFYSNVSKKQYYSPSKSDIINTYYPESHINLFQSITDIIAFNAYYIPVIKELMASGTGKGFINTFPYSYEIAYEMFMNSFLGLDSEIYYKILEDNLPTLQAYRRKLTFEHNPINKYIWSYNSEKRQYSVRYDSLHPSLQNDITNKYNSILNNELSVRGLTHKSFQTIKTKLANSKSIYYNLFSNLSTVLSDYLLGGEYSYSGEDYHITNLSTYHTVNDLHNDINFTSIFNYSSIFGKQFHSNFNGTLLRFTNFLDYHSTMSSYYNDIITTSSIISSIYGNITEEHHNYVSKKYSQVLPYNMIQSKLYNNSKGTPVKFFRNRYAYVNGLPVTDPKIVAESLIDIGIAAAALTNGPGVALPGYTPGVSGTGVHLGDTTSCEDECCRAIEDIIKRYYSCLPVNTIVADNPTNLGYLLGISPIPNSFTALEQTFGTTSTVSDSFNFLLQLNTEYSMNNMDIGMKENVAISNETTGQVDLMAAKILMQGVGTGEISETAIQNPILYETPLGKLDRLSFKIYIDDPAITPAWLYFPFDIGINEWDATFQIDEEVALADRNTGWSGNIPTIPIPNNPAAFQYMALTSTNNPNNK
jgi:hypothetical protein